MVFLYDAFNAPSLINAAVLDQSLTESSLVVLAMALKFSSFFKLQCRFLYKFWINSEKQTLFACYAWLKRKIYQLIELVFLKICFIDAII